MRTELDDHGQPIIRAFNAARIKQRGMDELIGLCRGILIDGSVDQKEAEYMLNWFEANPQAALEWPGNVIAARLVEFLKDGILDKDEQADLEQLFKQLTGGDPLPTISENQSTELPLSHPPPPIEFEGRIFCFTGKFVFGPRRACEAEVLQLGGKVAGSVTMKLDYLVIGLIGSRDWKHSSFGNKIIKAAEYAESGKAAISIVAEDHWADCVGNAAGPI